MTIDSAAQTIWEYMLMHRPLEKADAIFVLGSWDIRVAEYAVQLYLDGWAPIMLFSGSGSVHQEEEAWQHFSGSTEAEVFADIARKMDVPEEAIIIENQSQNTGENYEFSKKKLEERGVFLQRVIAVQKPFMERRTFATGKIWWPEVDIIVTSPPIPFENYATAAHNKEYVINNLVGDLQRIEDYPKRGWQIEQDIPADVWAAYEFLIDKGYTQRLIQW